MERFYTSEKNIQILIALMKENGIKKIVASPGATNVSFVASVQNDPFFEVYSSVDERSAAYIACGLSAESGEIVALSCTGATASRNYIPGLTEAYYRKLPILAITSTQRIGRIGHNVPQVIDRTVLLNDIARESVQVRVARDEEDVWECSIAINKAINALTARGGGPAHINLETEYSMDYSVKKLPEVQVIKVIDEATAEWPTLNNKKVAVFVGQHSKWTNELTFLVERFCDEYDAVVVCDQTSNYRGKHRVLVNLVTAQEQYYAECRNFDIMIDLGNISGAYIYLNPKEVWRVNPDGALCDTYKKLKYVFAMNEENFFRYYAKGNVVKCDYYNKWTEEINKIASKIPELPYSNIWIAQQTIKKIPKNSVLHLGILNSLRSWNFFESNSDTEIYSNTGGFGIDGCVSTLIGASLVNENKLYYGVVGDLAFFYDMNSIGNRHIGSNVRLMIVNNGRGTEFRNYNHKASKFGDNADCYMAAAGHYGNKSESLVKNLAQNLGFEYISASNKQEYLDELPRFVDTEIGQKSIVFEVFTDSNDESEALKMISNIEESPFYVTDTAKKVVRGIIGEKGVSSIKKIIKK